MAHEKPNLKFDILNIKTPQLIGIIAGCIVFVITICVVIYLLFKSGVVAGFLAEVQSGKPIDLSFLEGDQKEKQKKQVPILEEYPILFDHILEARQSLKSKPSCPVPLMGRRVIVRALRSSNSSNNSSCNINGDSNSNSDSNSDSNTDDGLLFEACNGSAVFDHPAYDTARMWTFLNSTLWSSTDVEVEKICGSKEGFLAFLTNACALENSTILVVEDIELSKPVGFVFIANNSVRNLTIEIDNIFITPAFQAKGYGLETLYLVLDWLFSQGYRRVTAPVDTRHIVARHLFEKSFFVLESIQRRVRIIKDRNSDLALYVILNSDWGLSISLKLKAKVGLDIKPPSVSAFAIQYDQTKHYLVLQSDKKSNSSNSSTNSNNKDSANSNHKKDQ